MSYVEYSSNNSGGSWWLTDDDWRALEAAGWDVQWATVEGEYSFAQLDKKGVPRYMGALATRATLPNATLEQAIRSFDSVTSCNSASLGCNCCGTPHHFTLRDDAGTYLDSWSPSFPSDGDTYY